MFPRTMTNQKNSHEILRIYQRLLTLQTGNSLISPKLTLSVDFSILIALHGATKLGVSWPLTRRDFAHVRVTLWLTAAFYLDANVMPGTVKFHIQVSAFI